jgi:CheY-like chemotaxis protein
MQPAPEKKAIIIVEDNAAVAEVIREVLSAEPQYRAIVAHDGLTALDVAHAVQASVVLLDVSLPGLSGPQVYEELRRDPRTRDVPVIFVTAHYDSPEFQRLGATNVIPKPFDLDDLLARVVAACGDPPAPPAAPAAPVPSSAPTPTGPGDTSDIVYYLALAG